MAVALIYLSLALIGLSLLLMIGFGLKNSGDVLKQSKLGLAAFALPVVIFVVAYAVDGSVTSAAVATALFTALSGFVALVIAGARGLFT